MKKHVEYRVYRKHRDHIGGPRFTTTKKRHALACLKECKSNYTDCKWWAVKITTEVLS